MPFFIQKFHPAETRLQIATEQLLRLRTGTGLDRQIRQIPCVQKTFLSIFLGDSAKEIQKASTVFCIVDTVILLLLNPPGRSRDIRRENQSKSEKSNLAGHFSTSSQGIVIMIREIPVCFNSCRSSLHRQSGGKEAVLI